MHITTATKAAKTVSLFLTERTRGAVEAGRVSRPPAWPADRLPEEAAEITALVALVQQTRGCGGL